MAATDQQTDLEQFLKYHQRLALWAARRRVNRSGGTLDPHDAESDALLGLWRAARTYDPRHGRSEPSWALYCIEHDITDGIRARLGRGRPRYLPTQPLEDSTATTPPFDVDVATRVDVARAVAHLTHKQRLAVVAYYWDGATLAEIGSALGTTDSAVSLLLQRGRDSLRAHLSRASRPKWQGQPADRPPQPASRRRAPKHEASCLHCGHEFSTALAGSRYCSNAHRQAAYRARKQLLNDYGPHHRVLRWWGPSSVSAPSRCTRELDQ